MLDICVEAATELDLKFNCAKCKCITFGVKKGITRANLTLNGVAIHWCDSLKYLGIVLKCSAHFTVDLSDVRRKFFGALSNILKKTAAASELCKLYVIEAHCLPLLLYCVEALNLNAPDLRSLGVWWNSVFRKLFAYNQWESVKTLMYYAGRLDLYHLVALRKLLFINRCRRTDNLVLQSVTEMFLSSSETRSLLKEFNVNLNMCKSVTKARLMFSFGERHEQ
jgi:hypothetical protein